MEPAAADARVVLTKSAINASRLLGLGDAVLANILRLTEAEVADMAQGVHPIDPEFSEGHKARQLVQLCRALDAVVGADQYGSTRIHARRQADDIEVSSN